MLGYHTCSDANAWRGHFGIDKIRQKVMFEVDRGQYYLPNSYQNTKIKGRINRIGEKMQLALQGLQCNRTTTYSVVQRRPRACRERVVNTIPLSDSRCANISFAACDTHPLRADSSE